MTRQHQGRRSRGQLQRKLPSSVSVGPTGNLGVAKKKQAPGKKRTRGQVIADQSHNYVEKFFIDKGHTVDYITDYGTDVVVNTFDKDGYAEGGDIRLQLKASDNLRYSKNGQYIAFSKLTPDDYDYWMKQKYPVFLVLYDAKKVKAYYLFVQAYFTTGGGKKPSKNAETFTVRVPIKNKMTKWTVDYMRKKKAEVLGVNVVYKA